MLDSKIPIIAEVPFINEKSAVQKISETESRDIFSESIRILLANLKFTFNEQTSPKSILVSSTIKGEGKTLISANMSNLLSISSKVILIGADLRNPQIHKLLDVDKDRKGLSDLLYKDDIDNYENYITKYKNLDILLSGTIPPNPTELLSGTKLVKLIEKLKTKYDFLIIDSAPCLLVSDSFELAKIVDSFVYIFRSNYTPDNLTTFINENVDQNKFKKINVVLNGIGSSQAYGYKYGYQYGYQYGYKYAYQYGYKYGNEQDV